MIKSRVPARLGKNISKVTEISLVFVHSSTVELSLLGRVGRVGTGTKKWAASDPFCTSKAFSRRTMLKKHCSLLFNDHNGVPEVNSVTQRK